MAIIFNIGESVKLSAFNILQEPIKMLMENETEAFEKGSKLSEVYVKGHPLKDKHHIILLILLI